MVIIKKVNINIPERFEKALEIIFQVNFYDLVGYGVDFQRREYKTERKLAIWLLNSYFTDSVVGDVFDVSSKSVWDINNVLSDYARNTHGQPDCISKIETKFNQLLIELC